MTPDLPRPKSKGEGGPNTEKELGLEWWKIWVTGYVTRSVCVVGILGVTEEK